MRALYIGEADAWMAGVWAGRGECKQIHKGQEIFLVLCFAFLSLAMVTCLLDFSPFLLVGRVLASASFRMRE